MYIVPAPLLSDGNIFLSLLTHLLIGIGIAVSVTGQLWLSLAYEALSKAVDTTR